MICLVLLSLNATAQEQEKRPSWSPPLPEKRTIPKSAVGLNKDLAEKEDITVDTATFDSDFSATDDTAIEDSLQINSTIIEPIDIDPADITSTPVDDIQDNTDTSSSLSEAVISSERIADQNNPGAKAIISATTANRSLNSAYAWTVIQSSPLRAPQTSRNSRTTVHLYVTINTDGRVVAVSPASANEDQRLAMQASRSVQKWRFEPPRKYGINGNMSGTLEIDLNP